MERGGLGEARKKGDGRGRVWPERVPGDAATGEHSLVNRRDRTSGVKSVVCGGDAVVTSV